MHNESFRVFKMKKAASTKGFLWHIGCSPRGERMAFKERTPMKVISTNTLRHNFAIWVMGRKPGWFKPQRYMYRCLRCKWSFVINDERRGSIRVAADTPGMTAEEEARRLATFADGPCPGYEEAHEVITGPRPNNVVPLRRDDRTRSARDARAV
jgi:hypothetical protein